MSLDLARTRTAASYSPKPLTNREMVASNTLRCFRELVQQLGGDPQILLHQAGIDPAALSKSESTIEYGALVRVMESAARKLSCPDFGLRLAAMQGGTTSISPVGVVMKNSQTLGKAIGYSVQYMHAQSLPVRVRFEPDRANHQLLVRCEFPAGGISENRQVVEHALMHASLNVLEISGGAARVQKVLFSHEPQSALRIYRRNFRCSVLFGQNVDGLFLKESDLLCPVSNPDARVYEMATSFIEARYSESEAPLAERVRSLIRLYLGREDCTAKRIATELCMHPRTLRRRLRADGTSFDTVKDEVRRDVALRYIREDGMTLKRLAELLDYSETSVLSHSFNRWFSTPPGQLRLKLRSDRATLRSQR